MSCSDFQQLKVLQSSLPALAQSEAGACKALIDTFNAWFAANYASPSGAFDDSHRVSNVTAFTSVPMAGTLVEP